MSTELREKVAQLYPGSKWRAVEVQVSDGKAKTIRGYYP